MYAKNKLAVAASSACLHFDSFSTRLEIKHGQTSNVKIRKLAYENRIVCRNGRLSLTYVLLFLKLNDSKSKEGVDTAYIVKLLDRIISEAVLLSVFYLLFSVFFCYFCSLLLNEIMYDCDD